ncbi:MAG: hypothetical protein LBT91_01250 [Bifidobacteriaceae bacterium]|jgi:hypothetical protein|nr:hypothetical protein [Bifidobacteriaceae bacterium]
MNFLKLKNFGILGFAFFFGIAIFMSGYNVGAWAESTGSVLPISKGGTGSNSPSGALDNLGKVNSVDSNSTDEQIPSAKAAYDYGQAIATGTITGEYFDIYWKKFANKTALLLISSQTLKADLTLPLSNFMTLPNIILPAKLTSYYPSMPVYFCSAKSCNQVAEAVLYIQCGGAEICEKITLRPINVVSFNKSDFILTGTLLYNTAT